MLNDTQTPETDEHGHPIGTMYRLRHPAADVDGYFYTEQSYRAMERRARLAEADVALVNWLETQGKDYGSDKGSSSIRPMKQWCVTKAGHGGTFRDTARAAIANDAK